MNPYVEIALRVVLFKEGKLHVAFSPLFNLSMNGSSEQDAKNALNTAIKMQFDFWKEKGLLETKLNEYGLSKFRQEEVDKRQKNGYSYIPTGSLSHHKVEKLNLQIPTA